MLLVKMEDWKYSLLSFSSASVPNGEFEITGKSVTYGLLKWCLLILNGKARMELFGATNVDTLDDNFDEALEGGLWGIPKLFSAIFLV